MVTATGDKKIGWLVGVQVNRGDHGDIGQVGATVGRMVAGVNPARLNFALLYQRLNGGAHRAQVDRNMGRVGNQVAVLIKQGAGEIESLFHVHRMCGVLQGDPHLFGDAHETVVINLQGYGVGLV